MQNLKPIRSEAEAREKGKKGGKASGASRRKRAELKQRFEVLLNCKTQEKDDKGRYLTGAEAMALKAFTSALSGDWKAWELVRDTAGQKPTEVIKLTPIDEQMLNEIDQMLSE